MHLGDAILKFMLVSHFYLGEEHFSEAKMTEMVSTHFDNKVLAAQLCESEFLSNHSDESETEKLKFNLKCILGSVFVLKQFDYDAVRSFYVKHILSSSRYPLPGV
mmetsp:Transcript_11032/g.27085  ORF Transcript_11032/g.27085 Transcript_11032/m.27085 type:complete len:105 (+) Transcript_11032:2582-2896(+)